MQLSSGSVLYYMRPYASFNIDKNPVLLVSERSAGIYLINLKSGKSVSLQPKDHREANQWFFDFRPGDADDDGCEGSRREKAKDSSSQESDSESDCDNSPDKFYSERNRAAFALPKKKRVKFRGTLDKHG